IESGQFRSDLYYRLNLLNLRLAPLRERPSDIPELVNFFVSKFACDYAKPTPKLTAEAMEQLCEYSWPGNARELRNLCERLTVLGESDTIDLGAIDRLELFHLDAPLGAPTAPPLESGHDRELMRLLTEERLRKQDLAKLLGVSRTTLWRRLNSIK
ncbi:MAG: helix-turn-helix domain-containing protein, partial [Angelakisella sp.]